MKIFLILLGLLGFYSGAYAEETTTMYRFKKPHICNLELGTCIYDNFLTFLEEMNDTKGMVMYLPLDLNNKSKLIELQSNKTQFPESVAVINYDKKGNSGEKSLMLFYKVDCSSYRFKAEAIFTYSELFGNGHNLGMQPLNVAWMKPKSQTMRLAIKQLCR